MVPRFALSLLFVAFASIAAAHVQDADRAQQPPPPAPTPAPTPQAQKAPEARRVPRADVQIEARGVPRVNVQIELTIIDQTGTAAPDKKVVSLLTADQRMGRIRANAETSKPSLGRVGTNLNVDARPSLLDGERILLELTLEYTPLRDSDVVRPTNLNESLTVILVNGKPLTISQAADPITDRRMTVEAKATILR